MICAEVQIYEIGQAAQLRRYLPTQLVSVEVQVCQNGQAAQLRRYLPAQLIVAEGQTYHAPAGVSGYAVPLSKGSIAQPVRVVTPVYRIRRFRRTR